MKNADLIKQINKELAIELAEKITLAQIHQQLCVYVNNLIVNNFENLISILNRIDVNEKKLKTILQQPHQLQAGNIIATLIIERQLEKIQSKKLFSNKPIKPTNEEKW